DEMAQESVHVGDADEDDAALRVDLARVDRRESRLVRVGEAESVEVAPPGGLRFGEDGEALAFARARGRGGTAREALEADAFLRELRVERADGLRERQDAAEIMRFGRTGGEALDARARELEDRPRPRERAREAAGDGVRGEDHLVDEL